MFYVINIFLLHILIILSLTISIISFFKIKYYATQLMWLITAYLVAIVFYSMILFYDHFNNLYLEKFQFIIIFLYFTVFLGIGLYCSRFHKVYLNVHFKKIYFLINILSFYLILFIMMLFVINSTSMTVISISGFAELFTFKAQYKSLFIIYLIFPIISILLYLFIVLKNNKVLSDTFKILSNLFFIQFLFFMILCIRNNNPEYLFTIFLITKICFNFFVIKNLTIEKGAYLNANFI